MTIVVNIIATAVLIAASAWIWQNTPKLFWGTMISEFPLLVSFLAVLLFLCIVNYFLGFVKRAE